jgi:hypothetical protein
VRRAVLHLALVAVTAVAASACVRAIEVGSEGSPVYRVAISNDLGEAMIVTANSGRGDSLLGSIPAGRSDTFVIARPASTTATITARNSSGTRTVGPITVELRAGATVPVRLR